MATGTTQLGRWLLAAAVALAVAVAGCTASGRSRAARAPGGGTSAGGLGVDPARVYAEYRFDAAPDVLSFGIQPLWIPTCVIWEVMARDERLREDLRRARCRLEAFSFFKGQDVNEYLRSGRLQGGIGGDLPALRAATETEVRIVGLIQQGPCSIIAREPMPLSRLRGRKVGYAPGSNAHYTLLRALGEHGLRPADVDLVPMDVLEMADALATGRIDAFSAWEPTPTLAMQAYPGFEVLARTEARGFLYFTRAFFERRPEVVRAMVAAELRALRWLGTNDKNVYVASRWARAQAVTFAGVDLPLTVYDFLRLARRDILRVPTAPRLSPELLAPGGELHRQFRQARQWKLIAPDADWARVRASFAEEIVPQIISAAGGASAEG